jgi:hypothetical protein
MNGLVNLSALEGIFALQVELSVVRLWREDNA